MSTGIKVPGLVSGEGTFAGVPCATLYIQNLNEKPSIELLKRELYYYFSPYGTILDIKIKKNLRMKGQAFVAFKTIEEASKALVARQGAFILHKPIVVRFARFKSYILSRYDGTYEEDQAKQEQDKGILYHFIIDIETRTAVKKLTRSQLQHQISATQSIDSIGIGADLGLPNKILFVQNIPKLNNPEDALNNLFSAHFGFKEVRLVPTKPDIAFVEYENDVYANAARLALDCYQILPGHELRVTFSKK